MNRRHAVMSCSRSLEEGESGLTLESVGPTVATGPGVRRNKEYTGLACLGGKGEAVESEQRQIRGGGI